MKALHFWKSLFPFGIFGLFIITILTGAAKPEGITPRADKWQTISGEWREPSRAESFLRQILEKPGTAALSVAIVQGSQVVFQKSIGIVDNETQKPVDDRTVFRTASLTKPVFAYLVKQNIQVVGICETPATPRINFWFYVREPFFD